MATRSAIFNERTGQLRYIHYDGYPEGVGSVLAIHYGTQDRVDDLYAHAASLDLSSLEPTLDTSEWFEEEELTFPGHYSVAEAHAAYKDADCVYLYAWDGVRWSVHF